MSLRVCHWLFKETYDRETQVENVVFAGMMVSLREIGGVQRVCRADRNIDGGPDIIGIAFDDSFANPSPSQVTNPVEALFFDGNQTCSQKDHVHTDKMTVLTVGGEFHTDHYILNPSDAEDQSELEIGSPLTVGFRETAGKILVPQNQDFPSVGKSLGGLIDGLLPLRMEVSGKIPPVKSHC